ncbi:MAG: glycine cleavage system protein R [Candidatus Brocadiia bacterium]|nr:hypothetical protein [Planctomycetota bacterium]
MPSNFVITVMSVDRVGIISDLSEAILDLEGNIDALSQTVVKGYFTIIVAASFEDDIEGERVAEEIRGKGQPGELGVLVKEQVPVADRPMVEEAQRLIITITGPDQKGIIHRITSYMASRGINIEDLYAVVKTDDFLLIAQIEVPPGREIERLQMDVQDLWSGDEVEVSLQHENVFLATSHVDFCQATPASSTRI